MKRHLSTIIFFIVLIAVWQIYAPSPDAGFQFLPRPSEIILYLEEVILNGSIFEAIWVTMQRLIYGYAIGLCIGIPMGMLTARYKFASDTVGVLALGLQALPSVCWAPLACYWYGQTEAAMLFVVIMGSLWSIILSTDNGMRNVPPIYARAARTMGAGPLYTLIKVTLPAAAPFVVSGMKQGWAFAWRSLMAAEIYVTITTGFGLGQLLHYGRSMMNMSQVISIMLVIILIGLLADKILFSPVENFLHKRWGTGKTTP